MPTSSLRSHAVTSRSSSIFVFTLTLLRVLVITATLLGHTAGAFASPHMPRSPLRSQHTTWQQAGIAGRIAFVSTRDSFRGEVYTMRTDGTGIVRLTTNNAEETDLQWSPDGTRLLFAKDTEIYVMKADGTQQTRLTISGYADRSPTWSPDGRRIAYVSSAFRIEDQIFVMNADGSNPRQLTTDLPINPQDLQWSPDGTEFVFAAPTGGIYTLKADGTGLTDIAQDSTAESPAWSPDGEKIAFVSRRDGNDEVYVMNADGTEQALLSRNRYNDADPTWSPDGSYIAFTSTSDSARGEVYIMNADGSNPRRVTNNTVDEYTLAWSASSSTFPYAVHLPLIVNARSPEALPGRIAFISTRDHYQGEVYMMKTDGTGVVRLTTNTAKESSLQWSLDGTRLLLAAQRDGNDEIITLAADGRDEVRLTTNEYTDAFPSWSPDGKRIAYVSSSFRVNNQIFVMNADGSEQRQLTTDLPINPQDLQWSPDGTQFVFAAPTGGIYTLKADGTGLTDIAQDSTAELPAWSPDGEKIAFVSRRDGNDDVYVMNADGTQQTLLSNNRYNDGDPAWSPDGRYIAFTSTSDSNQDDVYIMNADGTQPVRVTNSDADETSLTWTRD
jgi:Tol biopolymer transport system component